MGKNKADINGKSISNKTIEALARQAIYRTAEEENTELGVALKHISPEQLREITSGSYSRAATRAFKGRRSLTWMWQAACWVLIVGGAALWITLNHRQANYNIDEIVADYCMSSRGGEEPVNISDMDEEQVRESIPLLEKEYATADPDDVQECQMAGLNLAMAYLKIHDRKKAREILEELKMRFKDDEEFVRQCDRIIRTIR